MCAEPQTLSRWSRAAVGCRSQILNACDHGSPEHKGVMDSGAKLLRRVTAEKERLSHAVYNLQEALEQEVCRQDARAELVKRRAQ